MKVVINSPVWGDLIEIMDRIAPDNPQAALRIADAAKRTFAFIGDHPGIGMLRTFLQPAIR